MARARPPVRLAPAAAAAALLAALLAGCSAQAHREGADRRSYAAIAGKAPLVPGMTGDVRVDGAGAPELGALPVNREVFAFLDREAESEVGARVLGLDEALGVAFRHGREHQAWKERLYLEALSLTLDRYRYAPALRAAVGGDYEWDRRDRFAADMRELTGMDDPGPAASAETAYARTSIGARWLLRGGGAVALDLTANFTRFLTGGAGEFGAGALIGSFAQPLLRGAGAAVEAEALMQAERDLLYRLREFTRFRKRLAVRVASAYYSVLLDRETARNHHAGLEATRLSLERERAFQAEGLSTLLQVGRLEQSALQADLRWAASITRYQRGLDDFKVLIGLDADEAVMLDDGEMALIGASGMDAPDITLEAAAEMAARTRLDLYTALDRVQDGARRVRAAADGLRPGLDLALEAAAPGAANREPGELDFESTVYRAGLALDPPLDTRAAGAGYRRSLIDYEAAVRGYALALDGVKLDVLDAWRRMGEARRRHEIGLAGVAINERRVEEAELRAELGLGDIQDTVDSQNDLTAARTELAGAIVEHNIAKLEFWRDVGLLYIGDDGRWREGTDEPS